MAHRNQPPIVLLTDFGLRDPYVGIMKGVIAGIAPRSPVIDLTHHVSPQDIRQGAFLLETSAPYFPSGTIFVAVVDPGVGTARRAIALVDDRGLVFVSPDNGLLSGILGNRGIRACYAITNKARMLPEQSSTFHGRDLFAPAAAHLAAGAGPESLGEAVSAESCVRIAFPENATRDGGWTWNGEIVHADIYGNLVTSLPGDLASANDGTCLLTVNGRNAPLYATYGDVGEGRLVAYRGSSGFLEIAVRNGSAASVLGADAGTGVMLRNPSRPQPPRRR
ncbi:hypothetical protein CHL67_09755 [Prosthecochloris sp. GSB1]|uniref:SAM hydrolase/SAM-dependent halogenase family protein n=1 Tax=Prosthecochloris sp. GSB1 TaxID=281093 RepID=UPI000B8CA02B|nr:SAM-dependent chlorinase/fluorinase [Prosthecochloris sp. GSB1]ASQ91161.1 hypothetical protein CHL67_09755 [Prosthecochloris sp. GSB1]